MKLTVHRGANEIGGSCVEIATANTRILLDLGLPLNDDPGTLPPDVESLDAVLISHPHQDHFGLIEKIPDHIPVYLGAASLGLMQATRIFCDETPFTNTFRHYEAWNAFVIGDIGIKPYLVDHSAADAYAFQIDGDDKRVFYSGDFRAHGRKSKLFTRMINEPIPDIDVLLLEGTMLGRSNVKFPDEAAVENAITQELLRQGGAAFLICAGQNFDRLVSAFKACLKSERILIVDIYTAWVLRELSSSLKSRRIPDLSWNGIRVLSRGATAGRHYERIKKNRGHFGDFVHELYDRHNVITEDEIRESPGKYMIKTSYTDSLIRRLNMKPASVLYSMWAGYLTKKHNPRGYQSFKCLQHTAGIDFIQIHTSGHATLADLRQFADAMNPRKIVPIHTEHADMYTKNFGFKVRMLNDHVPFQL